MTTKNKILIIIAAVIIVEIIFVFLAPPFSLPDISHVEQTTLYGLTFNTITIYMILIASVLIIAIGLLLRMTLSRYPGRFQSAMELFVSFFDNIVSETLGKGKNTYIALIGTLFLFIWVSNAMGTIPFLQEPTRDLNVPFGCMLVVLAVVHGTAIKVRGVKGYLKGYAEPFLILAPLNIVGELAKGISLCFRLFGNILGGSIILLVISYLIRYVFLPVGLNLFFGLFVGTVQAFVFSLLALTYISVAISE